MIDFTKRRRTLRLIEADICKPPYDVNPQKSTTNNHNWRECLILIFRDNYGNEFDFVPRWSEVEMINTKKAEVEERNKELCKENLNNGTQN